MLVSLTTKQFQLISRENHQPHNFQSSQAPERFEQLKKHMSWSRIKDNYLSCDHLLYKAKTDRAESELDTDLGQLYLCI
jgi:hypothetical protein